MLLHRLHQWEFDRDQLRRGQPVDQQIIAQPIQRRQLSLVHPAAYRALVRPARNAESHPPRRFDPQHHLALIGQIAVHVQPLGRPVQQQIHLGHIAAALHNRLPRLVHPHRHIRVTAHRPPGVGTRGIRSRSKATDIPLQHILVRLDAAIQLVFRSRGNRRLQHPAGSTGAPRGGCARIGPRPPSSPRSPPRSCAPPARSCRPRSIPH